MPQTFLDFQRMWEFMEETDRMIRESNIKENIKKLIIWLFIWKDSKKKPSSDEK